MKTHLLFEIAAAIGSLATFGAFVMLFIKNKNKQEQLDRLTSISVGIETQADSLKAQNDLIVQQLSLVREIMLSNKKSDKAQRELLDFEKQRQRISAQPRITTGGSGHFGPRGPLYLNLLNKGELAIITSIDVFSEDVKFQFDTIPIELEKNILFKVLGLWE